MPHRARTSPPPTPVSSPRVSPTPPGSPTIAVRDATNATDSSTSSSTSNTGGLRPSTVPLRPVQPIAQPNGSVLLLDPGGPAHDSSDDMDIDEEGPQPMTIAVEPADQNHIIGLDSDGLENGGASGAEQEQEWTPEDWMADMRRVKVYELVGTTWSDRGTALCTGIYDEESDQAAIVAKSEVSDIELLRSEIHVSDVYQRQQDTLIVWTEPDGTDYALSFQDQEGCAEIWDFIIEVQRHFRGKTSEDEPTASSRLTIASILATSRLPEPALGIIPDLDNAIKAIARSPHGKERICEYLLHEDYIKNLIDVAEQAEDLESIEDLHALYSLMQTILSMNDHGVYNYILNEEIFLGVVGILEYDPEFPTHKASYRSFLQSSAHFTPLSHISFTDPTIPRKIHQTYRLTYLKDVVLARTLDDSTFNVLNSFIIFNQNDIITHIVQTDGFLEGVFKVFDDPAEGETSSTEVKPQDDATTNGERAGAPSPQLQSFAATVASTSSSKIVVTPPPTPTLSRRRADVLRFMHQLCLMGKNVQIPTRLTLYRALVERGLLRSIEWGLRYRNPNHASSSSSSAPNAPVPPSSAASNPTDDGEDEQALLDIAAEIFITVVDHHVLGVRAAIMRQIEAGKLPIPSSAATAQSVFGPPVTNAEKGSENDPENKDNLLTALVARLGGSKGGIPFRNQIGDSIRILLEVPVPGGMDAADKGIASMIREDPTTERFVQYFYDSCIDTMFKPLLDIVEWKAVGSLPLKLHREQSSLFLYLCDLLCVFFVQHAHRSQYFVLKSNVSTRIASLFRAREKHVKLGAVRFLRVCLRMNNNFVYRHLIKHELFLAILELTEREAGRDNLINAACQEFFEYIRKENIRMISSHIMEKYGDRIRTLAELPIVGPRFAGFVLRWEQNNGSAAAAAAAAAAVAATPTSASPAAPVSSSAKGRWGILESEEESYFNTSDDEEDEEVDDDFPDAVVPRKNAWTANTNKDESGQNWMSLKRKKGAAGGATGARGGVAKQQRIKAQAVIAAAGGDPASPTSNKVSTPPTSPIVVPQSYPVRLALVDYGDDEDEEQATSSSSLPFTPRVPPLSEGNASGGESERKLVRTDSVSNVSSLVSAAEGSTSPPSTSATTNGRTSPTPHSKDNNGSTLVRQRRGSISIADSHEQPPHMLSGSNPPLKRRRSEEDDDGDMMSSLLGNSKHKRRGSVDLSSSKSSSPGGAKGKGKESPEKNSSSSPMAPDTPPGAKKIKLSLKGAGTAVVGNNGALKDASSSSSSPNKASPTPTSKDGDEG